MLVSLPDVSRGYNQQGHITQIDIYGLTVGLQQTTSLMLS